MSTFFQDIRYALRMLRKAPAFTTVAVATIALGIAMNTAMFSVIYQLMLKPLPYSDPSRLVRVTWHALGANVDFLRASTVQFFQQHNVAYEAVGVRFPSTGCNLNGGSAPVFVDDAKVNRDFLRTLGVAPAIGRDFGTEDELSRNTAIITYGLWQEQFGGRENVIGQQLRCNDKSLTIVGILPRGFQYFDTPDVWLPDRIDNYLQDTGTNYSVIARLKRGLTHEQARQEMGLLFDQLKRETPRLQKYSWPAVGFDIEDYHAHSVGGLRYSLLLLGGAVMFVLLIACANVAGLLLARSTTRAREIAVRTALGASSGRILQQLLTETLALNAVAAIVGFGLGWAALVLIHAFIPARITAISPIDTNLLSAENWPVLLFTVALTGIAAVISGLAPSFHGARIDLVPSLKQGDHAAGEGRAQHRRRKFLLAAEVAVSLVLLVGSTLLVRSFVQLGRVDPGFDAHEVQVAQLSLASQRYASAARVAEFQRDLLERVKQTPGVQSAAEAAALPILRGLNLPMPPINGKECSEGNARWGFIEYRAISPEYLQTIRTPLLKGRQLLASDSGTSAPVALINDTYARLCWPNKDAIGAQLQVGLGKDQDSLRQIVGIAADTKSFGLDSPAPPTIYVPTSQVTDGVNKYLTQSYGFQSALLIRTPTPLSLSELQSLVHSVDPEQPVASVTSLESVIGRSVALPRFLMLLMTVFAVLALFLSAVGIYGLLNYYVTQRTREIGIRVALGAVQRDIMRLVFREGLAMVAAGALAGLVAAVAGGRLLRSLLFGISPFDPLTFAMAIAAIFAASALAAYVPARRALRVDPMVALRSE